MPSRRMRIAVSILSMILCLSLAAQYSPDFQLSGKTLYSVSAPTLREDTPVSQGVQSPNYLASVGGVAFDGVAKPAAGQSMTRFALSYNPQAENGARLRLTLGGQPVTVALYDWELVPIARFADSPYRAVFTLFGTVDDPKIQAKIDSSFDQSERAMNYHPAVSNTLMGLRMFQLDELILSEDSADLPTQGGRYVLGAGESSPSPHTGLQALARLDQGMDEIIHQSGADFQSYVICDYQQTVEFSVLNGELTLTGSPYYYFWNQKDDKINFLRELSNWTSNQDDLLEAVAQPWTNR